VIHVLVMGLPLVAGLILALLAHRGKWAPPLVVALGTGAALRVVVMVVAVQDPWQPWDMAEDFKSTADTVLDGRDPLVYLREGGWHFLPLLAYLLAGMRELGNFLGVPWTVMGRVVPVLADLALIPLVAKLTEGREGDPGRGARHAFQYACAPPVLMVSALHGQFPPITLALGIAALLAARNGRVHLTGLLIGLSVTTANWAALLLPGVLMTTRGWRGRLGVLGWTALVPLAFLVSSVPLLGTPVRELPESVAKSLSARAVIGDWGWTALVTGGSQAVEPGFGRIGMPVLALGLLAAAWWWRKAGPIRLTLALLLVFLIVTYRFGTQYLLWPIPYLLMLSRRGTLPVITVAGVWAAFGYVYMSRLDVFGWRDAHVWWAFSSFVVIALFVYVLPERRAPEPDEPPAEPPRSPSHATAAST